MKSKEEQACINPIETGKNKPFITANVREILDGDFTFSQQVYLFNEVAERFYASRTPEVKGYSKVFGGNLWEWQNEFYKEMDKYYPRAEHIPEIKDSVEEFQKIISSLLTPSTDAAVTVDEKDALNRIDLFCIESLPPEYFEKWEDVKSMLMKNRSKLKPLPEPPKKNN